MTRRALYHCTATVGTFTRTEQNVSTSNPGNFSRNFSSYCLFFDPPVRAEQISDLKLRRKKQKKFFFKLLKITCQIKNFSVSYFFFWKNKLSSNLLKLFSFLSLFYFGANYILFYFQTFFVAFASQTVSIQTMATSFKEM